MANSKEEKIILKNILKMMEKGGTCIRDEAGGKVRYETLADTILFKPFKESVRSAIITLFKHVKIRPELFPKDMVKSFSTYATGVGFFEDFWRCYETTSTTSTIPSYHKIIWKQMLKQIEAGIVKPLKIEYVENVKKLTFEDWKKSENITSSITKEQNAQLHYVYEQLNKEKSLSMTVHIKYNHKMLEHNKGFVKNQKVAYNGFSIMYPTTGKTVRHEFGGVAVNVPEYTEDVFNVKHWIFWDPWTHFKGGFGFTQTYSYLFHGGNIGVLSLYQGVVMNPGGGFDTESTKIKNIIHCFNVTNKTTWAAHIVENSDNGYKALVVPGDYDTPAATNNLVPFKFPPYDWDIEINKKPYRFETEVNGKYIFTWYDATNKDMIMMEPGEHLTEDGWLEGETQFGGDEVLDAFDRAENLEELNQWIEQNDVPGLIVLPDKNQVVGHPELTIPQAEEQLESQYPSYTTNPSALGLNVYSGRFGSVKAIINELWHGDFAAKIAKLIASPLDAIVGILTVPLKPTIGGNERVKIGNYVASASMDIVTSQFITQNIGYFEIEPIYEGTDASFLDYSQTKIELYVPYCGSVDLPTSSVMGKVVSVSLTVDVVTGLCCANVYADGGFTMALNGDASFHYPVSGANYSGSYGLDLQGFAKAAKEYLFGAGSTLSGTVSGSPAGHVNNRCVLTIHRPIAYYDAKGGINRTGGSIRRGTLSSFNGYVVCSKFYQKSGDFGLATKEELDEIERLLKGGVYL